jgi:aconitate hydratase
MDVACTIKKADGSSQAITLLCRIDTEDELEYFLNGGILHYVLRQLNRSA